MEGKEEMKHINQEQSGSDAYGLYGYNNRSMPIQMPLKEYNLASKSSMRRGKWTEEEIRYTDKIIEAFNAGSLQLPEGMGPVTLRSYLSEKLQCDPMRITKKYTGASCLGKRVYQGGSSGSKIAPDAIKAVEAELSSLEGEFRTRLEQSNREKRQHEADVEMLIKNHVVSTPAIDAMFMQSHIGASTAPPAMSPSPWACNYGQPMPYVMYPPPMNSSGMPFGNNGPMGYGGGFYEHGQAMRLPYEYYQNNYAMASAAIAMNQMRFIQQLMASGMSQPEAQARWIFAVNGGGLDEANHMESQHYLPTPAQVQWAQQAANAHAIYVPPPQSAAPSIGPLILGQQENNAQDGSTRVPSATSSNGSTAPDKKKPSKKVKNSTSTSTSTSAASSSQGSTKRQKTESLVVSPENSVSGDYAAADEENDHDIDNEERELKRSIKSKTTSPRKSSPKEGKKGTMNSHPTLQMPFPPQGTSSLGTSNGDTSSTNSLSSLCDSSDISEEDQNAASSLLGFSALCSEEPRMKCEGIAATF